MDFIAEKSKKGYFRAPVFTGRGDEGGNLTAFFRIFTNAFIMGHNRGYS